MLRKSNNVGILLAMLAAALYALNSPLSKLLLDSVPPVIMAGLLYLGAGIGMGAVSLIKKAAKKPSPKNGEGGKIGSQSGCFHFDCGQ